MLEIGDDLPELALDLHPKFVAEFAGEIGMGFGRFTDDEQARAEGLPGQIVPGNMSLALIARALLHWQPGVRLRRLGTTFRGLLRTGQTVHIRGNVTERHDHADGSATIECDVWVESAEGERLVIGTASLELAG